MSTGILRRTATSLTAFGLAAVTSALLTPACGSHRPSEAGASSSGTSSGAPTVTPPAGRGLQPVSLPDLSRMNDSARGQLQTRSQALQSKISDARTPSGDLGTAYGELGKILQAATFFDAAEASYQNAQTLAPTDRRWPYYLGHLYKVKGPLDKSVASFEQALSMQPDDVATLVWLGDAYLAQGAV